MTPSQFQIAIIGIVLLVFAVYVYAKERGLRNELIRLFKVFVIAESPFHPGLNKQTLFEAIVFEQLARRTISTEEASFLLRSIKCGTREAR